jgi:cytochrome oxidase Cu insertion factor (SCO1/SenC/PrrC family)
VRITLRTRLAILAAVAMLPAGGTCIAADPAAAAAPAPQAGESRTAARPAISGHFELESTDGRPVTDATYRGKWLVVYFGYTFCPDICPTVLTRVAQTLDILGPASEHVQPIFITVDPARDTASHLSQYLAAFGHNIVGLRGNADQTRAAAREFHVYYRMRSLGNGAYSVDHSSFLYVIAPDGQFAKLLADSLPPVQIAQELRQLFAHADDLAASAAGKALYLRSCSNCHGRRLQGQPLWQLEDEYSHRRAPAHDQSGHSWMHSDEDLFQMTRNGRFPSTALAQVSYMPGFRDSLTDAQIRRVIAFIKSSWPLGLRIAQAALNPGNPGVPGADAEADWTLPPTCTTAKQRWGYRPVNP